METQYTILDWFIPMMTVITAVTIFVTIYLRKKIIAKLHVNDKRKYDMFVRWFIVAEVLTMFLVWGIEILRLR